MSQGNIFDKIPDDLLNEQFQDIISTPGVRIERIISKGHSSPQSGWYDQQENEWVIVLEGAGVVVFEDGREFKLKKGDYLNIPQHTKHKVKWTDPSNITVWLAVFY
ncbi:MAG: cupin domain-containing protein [Pseudomonadales bacterium]|nr:cupin domain-containing protein [Pseudomonadales bacterium]